MEPCLLLLLREDESYGYELGERLKELGFEGSAADMATLYRTLRLLEQKGMVQSVWEQGTQGPAKRVYQLTAAGMALLRGWAATIQRNRARIDRFLALYEAGSPGDAGQPRQDAKHSEVEDDDS